jgi:hypothetical protein
MKRASIHKTPMLPVQTTSANQNGNRIPTALARGASR